MHFLDNVPAGAEAILAQIYHESFFDFRDRPSYRQDGRPGVWALDLRRPLSQSVILREVCAILLEELEAANVHQVVGAGVAAGLIVGGLVANGRDLRGGIVRDRRKAYGFREQIEGALSRDQPVAIVDDILASGTTMVRVADALEAEGYRIFAAFPIFEFGWRDGRATLQARGVETRPLARLNYNRVSAAPVRTIWEVVPSPQVVWEIKGTETFTISESGI
jgi:orotate phosphoribosyltransferase